MQLGTSWQGFSPIPNSVPSHFLAAINDFEAAIQNLQAGKLLPNTNMPQLTTQLSDTWYWRLTWLEGQAQVSNTLTEATLTLQGGAAIWSQNNLNFSETIFGVLEDDSWI